MKFRIMKDVFGKYYIRQRGFFFPFWFTLYNVLDEVIEFSSLEAAETFVSDLINGDRRHSLKDEVIKEISG